MTGISREPLQQQPLGHHLSVDKGTLYDSLILSGMATALRHASTPGFGKSPGLKADKGLRHEKKRTICDC